MTATVHHPLFARFYHRMRAGEVTLGVIDQRRAVLAGLSGRVLDVGAGDGGNFTLYPDTVTDVVAVEPEPYLRRLAERDTDCASVPVTVVDAVAEDLPFPDAAFDAVVSILVLCSVADPRRAAAEMVRVLRPGGELRFLEHIRADGGWLAVAQRVAAPVQSRAGGGCRPDRDTLGAFADAGLDLETVQHFEFHPTPLALLDRTRVKGVARRPQPED